MIKEQIEEKLNKDIEPWHLEVINESPNHNVPDGAELIYSVLNEEMQKIHAIAIHPFTPEEWKEKTGESLDSPKCLGGGND